LDADRLAIYLIDVAGHGVGAALLSVSVGNTLRTGALAEVDFGDPGAVLAGLNKSFPMEEHNNKYLTVWYGVYKTSTRELTYAKGGHPPPLLLTTAQGDPPSVKRLDSSGLVVGGFPDVSFEVGRVNATPGCYLYVFSDGVYEVRKPDGTEMGLDELERVVADEARSGVCHPENILKRIRKIHEQDTFEDDFSLLGVRFL
jgi:sigma-B regulation protein RsbU (phosphoserine phosphatase)